MASLATLIVAWEVLNHNLFHGWSAMPMQLIRLAVPLGLIWLIWLGHRWACFVLSGICVVTVAVNASAITLIANSFANDQVGDAILFILVLVGYSIIGSLSLFSSAISGLMHYRQDERDLR